MCECVCIYTYISIYAYLDVPLVCKMCAEIHQKNIHKRQTFLHIWKIQGIYIRIGLFCFVSFSCVFWLSIIMDRFFSLPKNHGACWKSGFGFLWTKLLVLKIVGPKKYFEVWQWGSNERSQGWCYIFLLNVRSVLEPPESSKSRGPG